jgi:NADH:ubiquinone reductase (H+-translocating)
MGNSELQRSDCPRIVIVGGGAGGLELATRLGDKLGKRGASRIVLIDQNPTHIWKPLLHEVAAGSMDPNTHLLEYAAQARWHGFEFQQGKLVGLDRQRKSVTVSAHVDSDGIEVLPERVIHYDALVLSVGSVTHFFNVPGAAEHAVALDTAIEAERFRKKLVAACMRAQSQVSGERPRVDIAIVGAGATGVELSAELRNTAEVLSAYGLHQLDPRNDVRIHLIEGGPRILPALSPRVSAEIVKLLRKLDVDVSTSDQVTEVTARSVLTASGRTIQSDLTVWAAGIRAPSILAELDLPVNRLGQVIVSQMLQVQGTDDIYAFGDCACCPSPNLPGNVPPRAQVAHQQANYLYKAMRRRLEGRPVSVFSFRDMGSLVSLGHLSAVGSLMGGIIGGTMFVEGVLARVMYASLYRRHMLTLHGFVRMSIDTVSHWLRSRTNPRVKLH